MLSILTTSHAALTQYLIQSGLRENVFIFTYIETDISNHGKESIVREGEGSSSLWPQLERKN